MKPIEGMNYDIATVFDLQYNSISHEVEIIAAAHIAYQIPQVLRATCIESEVYDLPDFARREPHSLMYFIELENQGMPFSDNQFIIPQKLIFSDRRMAIQYAIDARDRYQREVVMRNLKFSHKVFKIIRKYFLPLLSDIVVN